MLNTRPYSHPTDQAAVVDIWQRAGLTRPWNDPIKDIVRKLTVQPEMFLVGEADGNIVAVVMAGYDGHRGWINYLAVDPNARRKGYGKVMMDAATEKLTALGCPKINLQIRKDNAEVKAFYEALGYKEDNVLSMGKRLIED